MLTQEIVVAVSRRLKRISPPVRAPHFGPHELDTRITRALLIFDTVAHKQRKVRRVVFVVLCSKSVSGVNN